MKNIRVLLSKALFYGISLAFLLMIIGGLSFVISHANLHIDYKVFHTQPEVLTSLPEILKNVINFDPLAFTQIGIITLLIVQILKIILTSFYFMKNKDKPFVILSIFILVFMVLALFYQ